MRSTGASVSLNLSLKAGKCTPEFRDRGKRMHAAVEASGGLQTRRGVDARRLEGAPQAALHEIEPRARMSVCECDYNRDKIARSQKAIVRSSGTETIMVSRDSLRLSCGGAARVSRCSTCLPAVPLCSRLLHLRLMAASGCTGRSLTL